MPRVIYIRLAAALIDIWLLIDGDKESGNIKVFDSDWLS
jgi:hypothetical protein